MSIITNSTTQEKPQEQEPKQERIVLDVKSAPYTVDKLQSLVDLTNFANTAEMLNPNLKETLLEYDEIEKRELAELMGKFKRVSAWEFERLTFEMFLRLGEVLEANPFIKAVREELEKLKTNPAYKDAELDRLAFDHEGEDLRKPLTDNAHNLAMKLAIGNALATLSALPTVATQNKLKTAQGRHKGVLLTNGMIRHVLTEEGIIGKAIAYSHHPITRGRQEDRAITTMYSASLPDNMEFKGIKNLTGFEWEVLDAIQTLYYNGYDAFTIAQVYKTLTGSYRPSPQMVEDIEKVIEKLKKLEIIIDAKDEIAKRTGKRQRGAKPIEGNALYLFVFYKQVSGHMVKHYGFVTKPILLDYLEPTKGIKAFKEEALLVYNTVRQKGLDKKGHIKYEFVEADGTLPMTKARIVINRTLIRRYGQMLDNFGTLRENQSNVILFEPIYRLAEIDVDNITDRHILTDYNEATLLMIDNHVARGLTKWCGYKLRKEGRGGKLVGVEIQAKKPINQKTQKTTQKKGANSRAHKELTP